MTDVSGIFDEMKRARASIHEIIGGHIASRQSIELVEPDEGQDLPEVMKQSGSMRRILTVFAVSASVTLLLSLAALIITGFSFALAALSLLIAWSEKGGSGHLLLQNRAHVETGKTLLIVTVADNAVSRVLDVFRKHGAEVSSR